MTRTRRRIASPASAIVDILEVMDTEFVEDGYIRVYQDIRGLHRSEGAWVLNRPLAGPLNDTGIDESTDAYDTIDWLVKNTPESNGKVGVIGSSYLGFTTLDGADQSASGAEGGGSAKPDGRRLDGRRLVSQRRVSRQLARLPGGPGNQQGRTAAANSRSARATTTRATSKPAPSADFAKMLGIEKYPGVRKFLENPAYTEFWSLQAVDKWLAAHPLTVPTMLEVGQWDQEDSYGAPAVYRALEPKDKNNDMVVAAHRPVAALGRQSLWLRPRRADLHRRHGARMAREVREAVLRSLAEGRPGSEDAAGAHLRDRREPVERARRAGRWAPRSLSTWRRAAWPRSSAPRRAGTRNTSAIPRSRCRSSRARSTWAIATQWKPWLIRDQRFVTERPDVASWKSAPLDKAVHIMGAPEVELFASTTGTDSDWVVKLIDVYPNDVPEAASQGAKPSMAGYELPIGIEIFRGRYLKSFAQAGAAQARQGGALSLDAARRRPRVPAGPPDHGAGPVDACSRSTIAIRRPTSRTSCTRSRATIRRRRRASGLAAPTRARWCCRWCPESRPFFRRGGAVTPPPRRKLHSIQPGSFQRPHVVVDHIVGDLRATFLARRELEVEMNAAVDAAARLLLREL